jgi:uncharacterized FlaG/YvyC family protein
MDIKSVFRQVIPFQSPRAASAEPSKATTLEHTGDREPGGEGLDQGKQPKRDLTPEEIDEAIAVLKALDGVVNNGLLVRAQTTDGITVVYIEDASGKIVRRIPAAELSLLTKDRQKKTGHLINKAM